MWVVKDPHPRNGENYSGAKLYPDRALYHTYIRVCHPRPWDTVFPAVPIDCCPDRKSQGCGHLGIDNGLASTSVYYSKPQLVTKPNMGNGLRTIPLQCPPNICEPLSPPWDGR